MTIKEIAELAGVSISTVSKIVNNKDQYINPATRERVLKIVKEYNYTPYGMVKNLSTSRTFLLGVLMNKAPSSVRMINGIMQTAQAHGYSILLLDSDGNMQQELKHITTLCKNRVDGVIWLPAGEESGQQSHYFAEQGIPVCTIDSFLSEPSYSIDFAELSYAMTQSLVDRRHTKIACLFDTDSRRFPAMLEGYKRCLFDNQITFDRSLQLASGDSGSFRQLLESGATGVICSHLPDALSVCRELKTLHYDIPDDFSIVSLKDDPDDLCSMPRISGPLIPYYEFGSYVCGRLVSILEDTGAPAESEEYLFKPTTEMDGTDSIDSPPFLRAKKIVVVGSINTDFTFSVEHIPQSGKTITIQSAVTTPGGKGVNQAIGAARLGRQVSLMGEIGNDVYSSYIMRRLEDEHVATHGIHKDMNQPTGTAYIYIEKNGEGAITILPGANARLLPEKIRSQQFLFEKAGYCLISTEIPMQSAAEAARTARQYGVKTIVKPATAKSLPDELYANTDILVPNRREAAVLCPGCETPEAQADELLRRGAGTVIITLGDKGCYLRSPELSRYFPAVDTVPVDTTGGADAFISALASFLIEGCSLERAIRIAAYAAGFCIARQGVVAALIDRNTLESYIRKMEPELLE